MGCLPSRASSDAGGERAPKPFARAAPWCTSPAIDAPTLAQCRDDFWESRVEGSADMWAALRAAVDAARRGEYELAREVHKAAGLVLAGEGGEGALGKVYDERGVLMEVPRWVLRDADGVKEGTSTGELRVARRLLQEIE